GGAGGGTCLPAYRGEPTARPGDPDLSPDSTRARITELRGSGDPGHHPAQPGTDDLDRMLLALLDEFGERRPACVVLGNPFTGERAVLNLVQNLAHFRLHGGSDDPRAAGDVAVLGGVRDRMAHPGDAALVHEVHDELQFVQALEVGDFGRVTGFDESFEPGL